MTHHSRDLLFWKLLVTICAIGAIPMLIWSPARVGGIFLGALAIGTGGEYWALKLQNRHKCFYMISVLGKVLFALFILSFFIVQGVIISGMHMDTEAGNADAVLVLGARVYEDERPSATLAARLDTARDFLIEHPHAIAVLCGGQGSNEPVPEAHAMQEYLLERGIRPEQLLLEDASNNTIQNINNAKHLLENRFPNGFTTAVITSDFHLSRARRLMLHAGMDPYGVPAPTPYLAQRAALHIREYGSIMGLWLTGRW